MTDKQTILLVDDDSDVRQLLTAILGRSFNLLVAAHGIEALKIIADRQIDLLLTDIAMPGMNGFDLADQAISMRPGLRIVYMSAYFDLANAPRRKHRKLITKPFQPAQLVSEIRSALAG